jgi:hypothetical protein
VGISAAYPLSELEPDSARSIAEAGPLLRRLAERIAERVAGLQHGGFAPTTLQQSHHAATPRVTPEPPGGAAN